MTQQTHLARVTRYKFVDDTIGAIGGTVVHHHDLALQAFRQRRDECATQQGGDVFFFVEEGNQNR
jgi:hypothetical protein